MPSPVKRSFLFLGFFVLLLNACSEKDDKPDAPEPEETEKGTVITDDIVDS